VLHGIYGRGRNWTPIARRLAEALDDWRAVLVDLRGHGASPLPPAPHSVTECAKDLARLATHLETPIDAVLGHSFGGKVALQFAAVSPPGLKQVWVIDSTPAPKVPDGTAWQMLEVVRRHAGPFASRQQGVNALTGEGIAESVAAWMATNLGRDGTHYTWRLDVDAMEALLLDFFRTDLWHIIDLPPPGMTIHVVKALDSTLLGDEATARIEDAGRRHGRVQLHRVPGGHWLNTDNPEAIVTLLARELPRRLARAARRAAGGYR
jgi:pimeloyl-ACP methyl ester carboxylesterase